MILSKNLTITLVILGVLSLILIIYFIIKHFKSTPCSCDGKCNGECGGTCKCPFNQVCGADGKTCSTGSTGSTGSMFVAVGQGPDFSIASSPDGINNWKGITGSKSIFSVSGIRIAYNGKKWVAVGQGDACTIATSDDGTTWTPVPSSTNIFNLATGIAWNGNMWVAVGQGSVGGIIATSQDGTNWAAISTYSSGEQIFPGGARGITWNKNSSIWIAVGSGLPGNTNFRNTIATSPDGKKWTPVSNTALDYTGALAVACNSSDTCFAVGDTFAISNNGGKTWNSHGNDTSILLTGVYFKDDSTVAFTGIPSYNMNPKYSMLISILDNDEQVESDIITNCYGITNNNSIWVAVGESLDTDKKYGIATSPDGKNWTGLENSGNIFGTGGIINGIACVK